MSKSMSDLCSASAIPKAQITIYLLIIAITWVRTCGLWAKILRCCECHNYFCFTINLSMGGVMSIHIAHSKLLPRFSLDHIFWKIQPFISIFVSSIWIVAAIDIVEGPAISSLLHIRHSIKSQPEKFASEEEAIKWCLKSGVTKNQLSARGSIYNLIMLTGISLLIRRPHISPLKFYKITIWFSGNSLGIWFLNSIA